MPFKKPKFWDLKYISVYSFLLWPFSKIVDLINVFKKKEMKKYENIKLICAGNIYIGGTGKTSLAIEIHQMLKAKNLKSCFIKKFYVNQVDELKLLENYGKVFSSVNRTESVNNAIINGYKFAIFDDGLQDQSINYDISFLCFNNINWVGNGLTIPAGPLRENIKNIKKYKYIFLNGNLENLGNIKNYIYKINPNCQIFYGIYIPLNLNEFDLSKSYLAFSGIGNHQTFISMLKKNNFNIIKDIEYPDHYNYNSYDIDKLISIAKNLNCNLITTEKDFLRLNNENKNKVKFIKTKLQIKEKEKLLSIILSTNE